MTSYKGLKEVSHGGATAGYLTYLARYPEKKLSIALLCNGSPPPFSGQLVHSFVEEILGPFPEGQKEPEGVPMTEDQLKKYVGIWKNERSRNANRIAIDKGVLKLNNNTLKPMADGSFLLGSTAKMTFTADKDGKPIKADILNDDGSITNLTLQQEWAPTVADLTAFAGDWYSDEARTTLTFKVEGEKAFIVQPAAFKIELRPIYRDAFFAQGTVFWATRDASGKIDKLHATASRMRDMPFTRVR